MPTGKAALAPVCAPNGAANGICCALIGWLLEMWRKLTLDGVRVLI